MSKRKNLLQKAPTPPPPQPDQPLQLSAIGSRNTGLVCKKCGCKHFRTPVTWKIRNAIRRRRQCRNCGWETTSIEQLDGVPGT